MEKDCLAKNLTMKNIVLIITYAMVLILAVMNIDVIIKALSTFMSLLSPFLIGFILAFIFRLPMGFFERKLENKVKKGKKVLAALLALGCILLIIVFVVSTLVPVVVDSVQTLIANAPTYLDKLEELITALLDAFHLDKSILSTIEDYYDAIMESLLSMTQSALPSLFEALSSLISSITNLIMAIVVAIYIVACYDKLAYQAKRFLHAFLSEKAYAKTLYVIRISFDTFAHFCSGQFIEAIIIGVLCYVGALILRLDYAPILAVTIGCTNIIPIFGPIIGTFFCAVILLFVDPLQAVIFVVFGIVLQQFESKLIYPRVVGHSIGLSGLWVLAAVTIGGGLFGIVGMVLGLPFFAVLYRLLSEEVARRNDQKAEAKQTEINPTSPNEEA